MSEQYEPQVTVLVIIMGDDDSLITLHPDEKAAKKRLAEYVRNDWDKWDLESEPPADDGDAITAYFDFQKWSGDESYVISAADATPVVTGYLNHLADRFNRNLGRSWNSGDVVQALTEGEMPRYGVDPNYIAGGSL